MNYSESTKAVFERIQDLDPENVSKIIGYLLLKGYSKLEMIRLAFGPEYLLRSLIEKVKQDLTSSPNPSTPLLSPPKTKLPTNFTPFTPSSSRSPLETGQRNIPLVTVPATYHHPSVHNFQQPHLILPLEDQFMQYCHVHDFCPHFPEPSGAMICDNFQKGYCKYGGACKFLHVLGTENGGYMVLNPPNEPNIDRTFSRGALKQLEVEIIELLKSRRGIPVSISSLPILYYDKYERAFMVDVYLREAQCTVAQLFAYMTKCIRVIDRPHGRQSIILADDIHKYNRFIEERNGDEFIAANSCQVYLTFLPQSSFSDLDIYDYFENFGPVREVRIPNLDKRMYGFVTFVYPETAALVLTKTNPHFIGEAHVMVKPYRKTIVLDRKTEEKIEHAINSAPNQDAESKPPSIVELKRKEIVSETDHTLLLTSQSSSSDGSSTSQDKRTHVKTSINEPPESYEEIDLPESPFGYEVAELF
ncbi:hypothetical protein ABFX02_13G002800 [Erythranthe guttata]